MVAGCDFVQTRRAELNRINVFPVPDGDTGTNLALTASAIDSFAAERLSLLDLGGGAGLNAPSSGLERFKAGWSNASRMTYLCGRVFDRAAYQTLGGSGHADQGYFPAYRTGEYA